MDTLTKMKKYTKYTFFYRMRHPFSNWYKCKFVDSEGTEYNCSEQYMMAEKARLFGDEEVREMILAASDPRDQKELGRKVKNFDSVKWETNCKEIVYKGCYLKFSQNPKILATLEETRGTLLVEASPYDKIWGIGLGEDDPRIHDPKNWQGTNWLGEVLTKLRDDIFSK
jgi:ribA/ribD-fused uncharacterized protein